MRLAASTFLTIFVGALLGNAPAHADTLNFDDIDAFAGDFILDYLSPYHGYTFTNFSVYTSVPGFPGYNNGIVSGPNAAYTAGDAFGSPIVSTITAATPFDFTGAELLSSTRAREHYSYRAWPPERRSRTPLQAAPNLRITIAFRPSRRTYAPDN